MYNVGVIKKLNKHVNDRINHYQNLVIYGKKILTPYYVNYIGIDFMRLLEKAEIDKEQIRKVKDMYKNREVSYGWYRGKGTPEELENAVVELSEKVNSNLQKATPKGIREFMKLYGLGVDCSGFVFNVLNHAFEKENKLDLFLNSLNWGDPEKKQVNYAGDHVFKEKASTKIKISDVQPLDLVCSKEHIAIMVEISKELFVAQSALDSKSSGVNLSKFSPESNLPFNYLSTFGINWNELLKQGKIEFRRLKVLSK